MVGEMKAAVLFQKQDIRCVDMEEPCVKHGEVKVRIAAVGICGSDVPRYMEGRVHAFPLVLGHEFSGVVAEAGEGVSSVKPGDHVVGVPLLPCGTCPDCQKGNFALCRHYSFVGSRQQGALAEYVVLPEQNVVKIDAGIPLEQAVYFETSSVALHALRHVDYRGGGYVAVLGGGTIGLLALQWARILGAIKVVVIGRSHEHLAVAKRLGADAVFSSLDQSFIEQALDVTGGHGFDYIFEAAGAVQTMHMAFPLAASKARGCFIGTPVKDLRFSPSEWELMNRREFTLTGSWMSYSAPFPGDEWTLTAHFLASGQLRIDPGMTYMTFPLERVAEAFELFRERDKVKGRVVVVL